MARVFLAERNTRYDVSQAEQYGTIEYLLSDSCNPFNTIGMVQRLEAALKEKEFDAKEDFLCMTGNALTVAILLSVILQHNPIVKLLLFDARLSLYRERIFSPNSSLITEDIA